MRIYQNNPAHYSDFIALNEAWVKRYFVIEQSDIVLARDPGAIVRSGGTIFTAAEHGKIVGACGLLRDIDGQFELARMAVDPSYQGRGFGRALAEAAIDVAEAQGAIKITLLTNTILGSAVSLYRSLGFSTVQQGKHPQYSRCNMIMEKKMGNALSEGGTL